MAQFETCSADETQALGRQLAQQLPATGLVLLIGELGAGKTTLAKGIVEGLGAASADEVSSPTYTLIHEYGDPVRVYHIDLYRLESAEEVRGIGFRRHPRTGNARTCRMGRTLSGTPPGESGGSAAFSGKRQCTQRFSPTICATQPCPKHGWNITPGCYD